MMAEAVYIKEETDEGFGVKRRRLSITDTKDEIYIKEEKEIEIKEENNGLFEDDYICSDNNKPACILGLINDAEDEYTDLNLPERTSEVIPGPVIAESDDDKTDDEEEPTLPEVSNDAQDEDYVPENVVIEDDAASDDSEDSVQEDEISRPTTSRGRPKGRSGASKKRETAYSWRKKELEVAEIQKEKAFTTPDEVGSALHYFKKVFDDETFEFIAEQTNLYSVQATGSSVNTNSREMQDFISILLYTGLVDMPSYTYYWAQHTRFPPNADLMPLKRFQKLRRYIHFNDNGKADESSDETIRKNFMKLEEEVQFSIDEMMVPYKGTRAGNLCQLLDMSVVNAWLLYRRDTRLLGNGKPKPLCVFRSEIAFSLPRAGRSSRRGRPSSEEAPEPAKKIMRVVVPRPTTDVRYDNIDHWPIHADKGRCRLCPKGWSRMKCSKCQVVLCWTKERNCFLGFHKK